VESKDSWSILGGKLGFVNFPGTGNEPAKCGPGVAQQLQHIYKEYLLQFDTWYIQQMMESKRGMQTQMLATNSNLQAQMARLRWSPQQMQNVIAMANMPVAELHAQGVDDQMIRFVEANRSTLQRTFQEQKSFQAWVRAQQSGQQEAAGPRPPQAPPFGSNSQVQQQHQNTAMAMANRQQQHMLQQQLIQHQQQVAQQPQQMPGAMPGNGMPQRLPQGLQQPPHAQMPNFTFKTNSMPQALQFIQRIRQEITSISMFQPNLIFCCFNSRYPDIPNMPTVDVPVEQRVEYNQLLEQVYRQCTDTENKLPMVTVLVKQEEIVRRLVLIVSCSFLPHVSGISRRYSDLYGEPTTDPSFCGFGTSLHCQLGCFTSYGG